MAEVVERVQRLALPEEVVPQRLEPGEAAVVGPAAVGHVAGGRRPHAAARIGVDRPAAIVERVQELRQRLGRGRRLRAEAAQLGDLLAAALERPGPLHGRVAQRADRRPRGLRRTARAGSGRCPGSAPRAARRPAAGSARRSSWPRRRIVGSSSSRKPGSLLNVDASSLRRVAVISAVSPASSIQRVTSCLRASSCRDHRVGVADEVLDRACSGCPGCAAWRWSRAGPGARARSTGLEVLRAARPGRCPAR